MAIVIILALLQNIHRVGNPNFSASNPTELGLDLDAYSSKDLKISLDYPKNWYLEEKNYNIMLTTYPSSIGDNKTPTAKDLKIFFEIFMGCHDSLEENLIDPACGNGGLAVNENRIISKEERKTKAGTFYKYIVQSPKNKYTYYFLEGKNKIIRIEKTPGESQFEKEFEDLVNSIQFIK